MGWGIVGCLGGWWQRRRCACSVEEDGAKGLEGVGSPHAVVIANELAPPIVVCSRRRRRRQTLCLVGKEEEGLRGRRSKMDGVWLAYVLCIRTYVNFQ